MVLDRIFMFARFIALGLMILLGTQTASAMHIMEGYLPLGWCAFWYAVSLPFLVLSYRHIRALVVDNPKARISFALNTAFVFILSAQKLPSVGGSSSHLTGTSLGTLTTGLMSMPLVGFVVLLFQSLLLAHGGLSTLGANVFSLAIAGPFVAYLLYTSLERVGLKPLIAVFIATVFGSLATYITTSIQLAIVYPDAVGGMYASFLKFMGIFAYTQVPLSLLEGLMTCLIYRLMMRHGEISKERMGTPKLIVLSLFAVFCLAVPVVSNFVDFGSGADDQAGELVGRLAPEHNAEPLFSSFEPSEALEPWLFALQVLIGLSLLGWAVYAIRKQQGK